MKEQMDTIDSPTKRKATPIQSLRERDKVLLSINEEKKLRTENCFDFPLSSIKQKRKRKKTMMKEKQERAGMQ